MDETVSVGQTWKDNDPRCPGRYLRVLSIEGDYAICSVVNTVRKTRVALSRFKPGSTGYTQVESITS